MNRRQLFKNFAGVALLVSPFFSRVVRAALPSGRKYRDIKYVLIRDSTSSFDDKRLLDKADGILSKRDNRWRDQLITWDLQSDTDEIRGFIAKYGRNTKTFSWPILVAVPDSFESSDSPEVEIWTTAWLSHCEAKFEHVCYPVSPSSGWWSVEGDWNPTQVEVRDHLFNSPNHASGHFQLPWLTLLKLEELQSLHSDHHEEMINEGHVTWKDVNAECQPG